MSNIRRKQKPNTLAVTRQNTAEVRELLETSPALKTSPSPLGFWTISVEVTHFARKETWPAVVLEGDTIVITETEFEVHVGQPNTAQPRSRLPRYLMSAEEAMLIRERVWTPDIRRKHAEAYGFSTHRCHCQFGTSWQCGEGELHHKCIYGRESTSWYVPGTETVILWPDGTDAMFPEPVRTTRNKSGRTWDDHRAIVWLADRECVTRCACFCHQDILSFPPDPMSEEAAAWVRAYAWTPKMRKTFAEVPGHYLKCGCQGGVTGHCEAGRHGKCTAGEARVTVEGWITTSSETVLDSVGGQVWLGDRTCRYRCPCDCHDGKVPPLPAREDVALGDSVQLDLFG